MRVQDSPQTRPASQTIPRRYHMNPTLKYYMAKASAVVNNSYHYKHALARLAEIEYRAQRQLDDNDLITLAVHINNLMGNKAY